MDQIFYICLPTTIYGLAAQQILEVIDAVFLPGRRVAFKKAISKMFSVGIGGALTATFWAGHSLKPLELLVAGLLTAAFSEAWNALLKSLVYNKEIRKAQAAHAFSAAGVISLDAISRK